jgi:hypothetical protein
MLLEGIERRDRVAIRQRREARNTGIDADRFIEQVSNAIASAFASGTSDREKTARLWLYTAGSPLAIIGRKLSASARSVFP